MLEITRLRLKHAVREPMLIIMMTVLPIIFISFVSFISFGPSTQGTDSGVLVHVGLVDHDETTVAADFAAFLEADGRVSTTRFDSEETAVAELRADQLNAVVVVPRGFGSSVMRQENTQVELLENRLAVTPSLSGQIVTQVTQGFSARLSTASAIVRLTRTAPAGGLSWQRSYELISDLWSPQPPLSLVEANYVAGAGSTEPARHDHEAEAVVGTITPGYVVMFVMMLGAIGASSLIEERREGTLARLVAAPIGRLQIIGGYALAWCAQGLVQAIVLFGFAALVFGMSLGNSPLALAVIMLCFLVMSVGFGMLLASVVRSPAQAGASGSLVVVLLSFLGGVWWPVEMMPRVMQQVARFTPTYWASQGLANVLARGQGVASVLNYSAYLLLLGSLMLFLGSWLLSRQEV